MKLRWSQSCFEGNLLYEPCSNRTSIATRKQFFQIEIRELISPRRARINFAFDELPITAECAFEYFLSQTEPLNRIRNENIMTLHNSPGPPFSTACSVYRKNIEKFEKTVRRKLPHWNTPGFRPLSSASEKGGSKRIAGKVARGVPQLSEISTPPSIPSATRAPINVYNLLEVFLSARGGHSFREVLSRARATAFELSSVRETGTKKARGRLEGQRGRTQVERGVGAGGGGSSRASGVTE